MKFSSTVNFSILAAVALAFVGSIRTCSAGDDDPNARSEKDIPGVAMENGSFTTLVAALTAIDLVGALSSPVGPFTVFAPTDDAFDALPNGFVECLLQEQNLPLLSNILLYHVASGEAVSTDLMNKMRIPTLLSGEEVTVDLNNGGVKINDSTVVVSDVLASNGVIHVLNQVLVPPTVDVGAFLQTCSNTGDSSASSSSSSSLVDIPTTAINAGIFSTLVAALSATDLVGALSEPAGPFTVFAPNDDAFNALPTGLVSCLLEEKNLPILSDILLYHVASGKALSTDLSNGQQVPTLLDGVEVTVDLNNGVMINDSTVVGADVLASNGVIHVLNQVLVPPSVDVGAFLQTCNNNGDSASSSSSSSSSLVDIPTTAINAGIFSTLVAALSATGLVGAISDPKGPFTVFAPNDDAFNALPDGLVSCLLEEKNLPVLSDILSYHVASGTALSTDLSNGLQLSTLLDGVKVTVDLNNGVMINDSTVVGADVLASNGVIHIIDAVLVPPGIDVAAFLQTCSYGNGNGSSHSVQPPTHTSTNNDSCVYLGVQRSAGQSLVGPTHTCVCTYGGAWTHCRTNQDMGGTSLKTIEQFVLDSPHFTTLKAAVVQADLVGVLGDSTTGPFTLFAPTDTAFADVPPAVVNYLFDDANQATLGEVLSYHITQGSIPADDIPEGSMTQVDTLLGNNDQIVVSKTCYSATAIEAGQEACGDNYSLLLDNSSNVIATDIQTSNGIIHVITKVLIPPSLRDAVAGLVGN